MTFNASGGYTFSWPLEVQIAELLLETEIGKDIAIIANQDNSALERKVIIRTV